MELLEKLNHYGIDWCFQCASTAYRKSNKKKQSFTYNLIQFCRQLNPKEDYAFFTVPLDNSFSFIFKPGILKKFTDENNNSKYSIEKYKYKKSFYKGLIPILEEHFKICGDERLHRFKIYLEKNNLTIFVI